MASCPNCGLSLAPREEGHFICPACGQSLYISEAHSELLEWKISESPRTCGFNLVMPAPDVYDVVKHTHKDTIALIQYGNYLFSFRDDADMVARIADVNKLEAPSVCWFNVNEETLERIWEFVVVQNDTSDDS